MLPLSHEAIRSNTGEGPPPRRVRTTSGTPSDLGRCLSSDQGRIFAAAPARSGWKPPMNWRRPNGMPAATTPTAIWVGQRLYGACDKSQPSAPSPATMAEAGGGRPVLAIVWQKAALGAARPRVSARNVPMIAAPRTPPRAAAVAGRRGRRPIQACRGLQKCPSRAAPPRAAPPINPPSAASRPGGIAAIVLLPRGSGHPRLRVGPSGRKVRSTSRSCARSSGRSRNSRSPFRRGGPSPIFRAVAARAAG